MAYYVKVKPEVRNRILPSYIQGTKSADGNVILFQSDLANVEGMTLSERAANVGGALLTPEEAKREIDGTTTSPAVCYDPMTRNSNQENGTDDGTITTSQGVNIPSVDGSDVVNNQTESEVEND